MKPTIIIVEGKSDTNRLKQLDPNIITFQTSGLGLDDNKIKQLQKLSKDYRLIVLTDPDGPGERIRKKINDNIKGVYHAFLPSSKALSKDQHHVGIEHANIKDIKHALENLYLFDDNNYQKYSVSDLLSWGIYDNKTLRKTFCDKLNISFGNNKKVVNQLNSFQISENKIKEILKEMNL